jgi:hypothetical protein
MSDEELVRSIKEDWKNSKRKPDSPEQLRQAIIDTKKFYRFQDQSSDDFTPFENAFMRITRLHPEYDLKQLSDSIAGGVKIDENGLYYQGEIDPITPSSTDYTRTIVISLGLVAFVYWRFKS